MGCELPHVAVSSVIVILAWSVSLCRVLQGEMLFREGDPCHKVYFLLDGEVEMSKRSVLRSGVEIIVEHAHSPSILALSEAAMGAAVHRVRHRVLYPWHGMSGLCPCHGLSGLCKPLAWKEWAVQTLGTE